MVGRRRSEREGMRLGRFAEHTYKSKQTFPLSSACFRGLEHAFAEFSHEWMDFHNSVFAIATWKTGNKSRRL